MKKETDLKNKKMLLVCLLLAMYTSFGLSINILAMGEDEILEKFSVQDSFARSYACFMASLRDLGAGTLIFSLCAVAVFFLFLSAFRNRYHRSEIIICILISTVFALSHWVGIIFAQHDSWDTFLKNDYLKLKNLIYISSWSLIVFAVLLVLTTYTKKGFFSETANNLDYNKVSSSKDQNHLRRVFFASFAILLVCWLPYYASFWPGVLHGDVCAQLVQYYHYPTSFQGRWVTDGVTTVYSNDHPLIHTLYVGKILNWGVKIGRLDIGISMIVTIQMICFIIAFSFLITTLYHFQIHSGLLRGLLAIYALCPVFPMYSIMISGDTLLALVFLLFVTAMIWIYKSDGAVTRSKRFLGAVFLLVFLMGAVKNQGIYICIVTIVAVLFCYHRQWKRICIAMVLPILIFFFGYQGLFFQEYHVKSVGKQEALSLFFQQTARYIKYHDEEVTAEEMEAIDAVLDYQTIAENYDANKSDAVKSTFKETASSKDMKNYFSVWFKMGLKHPVEYLQASVSGTWKYYSPGVYKRMNVFYNKIATLRSYYERRKSLYEGILPEKFIDQLSYIPPEERIIQREKMNAFITLLEYVPVINWMILPGYMTWIMIGGYYIMWHKKRYKMMVIFLPVFLVFGVCLLSPVNGNVRYYFPAYTIIPAMVGMALNNTDEIGIEDGKGRV